jgi:hypothetical protein
MVCAPVRICQVTRFPHSAHLRTGTYPLYTSVMTSKRPSKRKKPLTISEVARMGGKATAKNLTPEERKKSASKAAKARWEKEKKGGSHGS